MAGRPVRRVRALRQPGPGGPGPCSGPAELASLTWVFAAFPGRIAAGT